MVQLPLGAHSRGSISLGVGTDTALDISFLTMIHVMKAGIKKSPQEGGERRRGGGGG